MAILDPSVSMSKMSKKATLAKKLHNQTDPTLYMIFILPWAKLCQYNYQFNFQCYSCR